MNKFDLAISMTRLLNSKIASTYFINGSFGSGKKHLLSDLATSMPSAIPALQILGPYQSSKDPIPSRILSDLLDMQFLSERAPDGTDLDWNTTWFWLKNNLNVSRRLNVLVLINIDDISINHYEKWSVWLSGARYLEHFWDDNKIHVLVLISGSWDHVGLEKFYDSIQLSFPYTVSQNQLVWNQISKEDVIGIVKKEFSEDSLAESYGKLIFEITGGHPGAIKDILSNTSKEELSTQEIIRATHQAAMYGIYGQELIKSWQILSTNEIKILRHLVLYKRLPKGTNSSNLDRLYNLGIIEYKNVLNRKYVNLKSWYVQLLVKCHAKSIGLVDKEWDKLIFEEFMPTIADWNIEAYRIINDVENLIRNFAVTCLLELEQENEHILHNRVLKRIKNSSKNEDDDAYIRASDWKERSRYHGLPVDLNPLIAYISTSDLSSLIEELASYLDPSWLEIAKLVEKIGYIRDAVMHNQVIDEKALQNLYDLQSKVYVALTGRFNENLSFH